MADEKYKSVSMFALPDAYQQQAAEARRRRRIAEMLAQQAYQPGDIQNAPIPRGAPLVQGLQAYLTARAARKADEAEETAAKTKAQFEADTERQIDATGAQIAGRLTGRKVVPVVPGAPVVPFDSAALQEQRRIGEEENLLQLNAEEQAQLKAGDIREVALKSQYAYDPQDAVRLGMTKTGAAAMRGNPVLAAMLAKTMETPKEAEYGTTPQFDKEGRAFVVNKAGDVRYLKDVKAPAAAPAAVTLATIMKNGRKVVVDARTGAEIGPAPADAPASLGPLEYVIGKNGKPELVTRANAVGRQRAPQPTTPRTGPTGDTSADRRDYRTSKRALQNAYNVVNDFLQSLRTTPKEESLVGEKAGALSTKYKLALGAVRILQNTGVLNPGELPFIEDTLRDPQKISQLFNPSSRESIVGQIDAIADSLESQSTTLDDSYGYDAVPLRGSETRRANRVPAAAAAAGITQEEWNNSTEEERKPWR